MFERFSRDARHVVAVAREEAGALGAPEVEAEHLLLALSTGVPGRARATLEELGLDHDGVRAALEDERADALAVVGVSAPGPEAVPRSAPAGWGASAKLALQRALDAAVARSDRAMLPEHLLLGVIAAEVGTVPRALAVAGIERGEILSRLP